MFAAYTVKRIRESQESLTDEGALYNGRFKKKAHYKRRFQNKGALYIGAL